MYLCRFIVRDYDYNPKTEAAESEEKGKLEIHIKKQFVSILLYHLSIIRTTLT